MITWRVDIPSLTPGLRWAFYHKVINAIQQMFNRGGFMTPQLAEDPMKPFKPTYLHIQLRIVGARVGQIISTAMILHNVVNLGKKDPLCSII